MRPLRLELVGFTSFKKRTVVSFEDAGYFAFVGPTGAGKSSLIDAICFALYGSVPRYDDKRLKGAVITQGRLEARVRLDFAVGNARYSAVRVVRRDARGSASTKEARLERDGEVIAGTGPEVTAAAQRLIGLTFDHFTKCVALPQGEFARFLHDDPGKRQELLVDLLDLGVYKDMMRAANHLAARAESQAELIQKQLEEDLAYATDAHLAEARRRIEHLRGLRARLDESAPRLRRLAEDLEAARRELQDARRWAADLASLAVPVAAAELADHLAHARALQIDADGALFEAEGRTAAAQAGREGLPERGPLEAVLAAHDRRAALEARAADAAADLVSSVEAESRAEAARRKAASEVAAAEQRVSEVRHNHLAQHLAAGLTTGRPCPVCLQRVEALPEHAPAPELSEVEAGADRARASLEAASTAALEALAERHRREAAVRALEEQTAEIDGQLRTGPARAAAERTLAAIERSEAELADARAAETRARDAARKAGRALSDLGEQERQLRVAYQLRRDSFAPLAPPAPEGKDLAADWEALVAWAREVASGREIAAREAEGRANDAARLLEELTESMRRECGDCGVELEAREPSEAVIVAVTMAEAEAERVEAGMAEAERLQKLLRELRLENEVAARLAQHLSARGFEKWIVNEALDRLVGGAGGVLRGLSGEQYSLALDDAGNFMVIDHHNANERRSAKTLSGGETFLASLSLALALAEHLAELASEGSARLESVFLDEGFGTLDSETLDTVAATVENLAAGGRIVGVVTHVRDLAERVPLQFRVTKDGRGSHVLRVQS